MFSNYDDIREDILTVDKDVVNTVKSHWKGFIKTALLFGTSYAIIVFLYVMSRTKDISKAAKETEITLARAWTPRFVSELIRTKKRLDSEE